MAFRNPKTEWRINDEARMTSAGRSAPWGGLRAWAFGLGSSFGFRISPFRGGAGVPKRNESRLGAPAACVGLVLFLAFPAVGRGETVVANDGKSYTGKVTVTPHVVHCVSPGINRTFALTVVKAIEMSGPERMEFEVRQRNLRPLDPDALYRLGAWLKSKYQHDLAQEFFNKTIAVLADHEDARRELGYVRKQGTWEYSPSLHQQMMYDWVGVKSAPFHLKLAQELDGLKRTKQEEQELRRVLQADGINPTAIRLIRPIVAGCRLKNRYKLPFTGTWRAISGPNLTGHGDYAYMMNAWDFRKVDEKGETSSGPVDDLKSYYTFEQPVYACADGEVYEVRGEFPDNPVGTVRPVTEANRILLQHASGERSVVGHLQKGSIQVKVGDRVKQGQLLALLGNSGRSATPHLHFAIFDDDGVSLPMTFVDFFVREGADRKHVESGKMELGHVYENSFDDAKPK